jgi:hypothetical protein
VGFLKEGHIPTTWSCYQQSYATPRGLLRVSAQLSPREPVGELVALSNEVMMAIVSQP